MKSLVRLSLLLAIGCFRLCGQTSTSTPPQIVLELSPAHIAATGSADSSAPFLAADGTRVVFTSAAANLVTNDANGALDVFLYDRPSRHISLVSIDASGSNSANGRSFALDFSRDGRFVLFESEANHLAGNDTNNAADLFLRDLLLGQTTIVSVDTNYAPAGPFYHPSLSPDGRFLLFDSFPRRLVTNSVVSCDVYLRDLQNGSCRLVSVRADGTAGGSSVSESAVMTPDGRWIAFQSRAANLVTNDAGSNLDVYLRDLESETTVLVSVNPAGGSTTTYASSNPAVSADGRFVAFESKAPDLATNPTPAGFTSLIYVRDVVAMTTTCVSLAADNGVAYRPVISADGGWVAYESQSNVYCCHRSTLQSFVMSTNSLGAGGSDLSFAPQFTPNGAYCLFLSYATNLVPNIGRTYQCQAYRRDMRTGEIQLLSGSTGPEGAFTGTLAADISDDGNTVAFASAEPGLATSDSNGSSDVFVHHVLTSTNELVSARTMSNPALANPARSWSWANCVSADGRYVVFYSAALNLVTNPVGGLENLCVRDLWTGRNTLVTVGLDGKDCGNGSHFAPFISGNGRWVAFQSSATNLVASDTNKFSDVFVHDILAGANRLVSVPWTRVGFANNSSASPSIDDNGRFVVFQSAASNLVPGDPVVGWDAFAWDSTQETNKPLSVRYDGTLCVGGQSIAPNGVLNPFAPLVTPDGQWVLLWSTVNLSSLANLSGTPYCFAKHLSTGQLVPVGIETAGLLRSANRSASLSPGGRFAAFTTSSNAIGVFDFVSQTPAAAVAPGWNPSLSADGRWLAFEARATDHGTNSGNPVSDIFLCDRVTEAVRLVSVNRSGTAGGNGPSSTPLLSSDGRYVVFKSKASNLVDGDTNEFTDVFVSDLLSGTLFAISASTGPAPGNRLSGNPFLARDGRTVLFESYASNLASGDLNEAKDLFILRLPGDLTAEFRVLTLTSLAGGSATLFWNALPGRTYRIEYRDRFGDAGWQELPGDVVAAGYSASKTDTSSVSSGARYYRIRLLD